MKTQTIRDPSILPRKVKLLYNLRSIYDIHFIQIQIPIPVPANYYEIMIELNNSKYFNFAVDIIESMVDDGWNMSYVIQNPRSIVTPSNYSIQMKFEKYV